jgi:hypothetical protein
MSILADRAVGLLEYLRVGDPVADGLLEALVRGLLDPADRLSLVAHGDGTIGPWQAITDPGVAEMWALPTASQWTGGVMPPRAVGETDDAYLPRARAEVVQPRGMRRGSAPALQVAARPHLTGTQTVRVAERLDGDAWQAGVLVLEAELIDLDALVAAVNDPDVITAGMRAVVDFLPTDLAWTVLELEGTYYSRTILDMEGDFATVLDLENNDPS